MKEILITNSDNNPIKETIQKMKQLEGMVRTYESEIKKLKDKIKETNLEKITIIDGNEATICTISQYTTNRKSINEDRLKSLVGDKYDSLFDTKEIKSVRVTIK